MMMHILFTFICKQWDFKGMLSLSKEALQNNLKKSAFVVACTLTQLITPTLYIHGIRTASQNFIFLGVFSKERDY